MHTTEDVEGDYLPVSHDITSVRIASWSEDSCGSAAIQGRVAAFDPVRDSQKEYLQAT